MLNLRDRTVVYLDPLLQESKPEYIIRRLLRFLKAEMWMHQKEHIENTVWRDLKYGDPSEHSLFDSQDSGVFVCRQAELLTQQGDCVPNKAETYRRQIQESVLRASRLI